MTSTEPIIVGGGAPERSNRRVKIIAGVAAVVFLAILVLPRLSGGGGGEDEFAFPPPTPTPGTGATPIVPAEDTPPRSFESFSSKNPFVPLVNIGGGGSATPPADVPPALPDDGGFVFPDDGDFEFPDDGDVDGDPGTDPTPPDEPPAPPPRLPDRVSLVEVYRDLEGRVVASVRVNDIVHQVTTGDDFAASFRVVSLDLTTRCAELLFGDERFGLCEGDEALK